MKTLQEFENYYNSSLLPDIEPLEKERIKVKNRLLIVLTIIAVLGIGLFMLTKDNRAISIPVFIGLVMYSRIMKGYSLNFKDQVINKIIYFINSNLSYRKSSYISRMEFENSELFHSFNRYKGDDYVEGNIVDDEYLKRTGKTRSIHIEFSELNVLEDNDPWKINRTITVFKGLFFVADFNKNFKGYTKVVPDYKLNLFQGHNRVTLEDPEFEKYFQVYGDDQVEARFILSTSLMKRITDFRKKSGRKIYIAFKHNKIYIAIRYSENLFEPKVFETLYDFEIMKDYFEDLELALGIVGDLNLHLKIWADD
jgi:hypothetical protein